MLRKIIANTSFPHAMLWYPRDGDSSGTASVTHRPQHTPHPCPNECVLQNELFSRLWSLFLPCTWCSGKQLDPSDHRRCACNRAENKVAPRL